MISRVTDRNLSISISGVCVNSSSPPPPPPPRPVKEKIRQLERHEKKNFQFNLMKLTFVLAIYFVQNMCHFKSIECKIEQGVCVCVYASVHLVVGQ